MSDLTYTKLRDYHRRVAAMLADPECVDDLLLLGISLLDYAVLRTDDSKTFDHYAAKVFEDRQWRRYQVKDILRKDIRRYDAVQDATERDPARVCQAPMVRRQGPCGKSASRRGLITDDLTGRKQWLAACTRHREWFDSAALANRAIVAEAPEIMRPAANAGGVLARHIPEIDWPAVWLAQDPTWTPPPEAEPEVVPLTPRLTLVLGGAS